MLAILLQGNGGGGFAAYGQLLLLPVMLGLLYFLTIRPNQAKQKKWQEMLSSLKSGDKVVTNGGLRGTVFSVKDDAVIVRVQPDGVKLEVVKGSIATVTTGDTA